MTGTSNRRFSTADLENLTEGTTPGPWEWHDNGARDMRFIYSEDGNLCLIVDDSGSTYMPADPLLAAAAPALAADLHRVLTELEALRDQHIYREDYHRDCSNDSTDEADTRCSMRLALRHRHMHQEITRILGDNHE